MPAIVDFAAMRDALQHFGGDPGSINPVRPTDLVIDHSLQVDVSRKLIVQAPAQKTAESSSVGQHSTSKRSIMQPTFYQQQQQQQTRQTNSPYFRQSLTQSFHSSPFQLNNDSNNSFMNKNTNFVLSSENNSNSNQILIESTYKNCPFHNIKTEWYAYIIKT